MRFLCIRGLLLVLLLFCGGVHGQETLLTLETTGSADGQGYRAKSLAVQDAQYNALLTVVQRLAPSMEQKILRPIFRNAHTYLAGYDMVRHEHVRGRTEVDLEVRIREGLLRHDTALFLLPRLPERPTCLLLIGEQFPDDKVMGVIDYGVVEVTLTEQLEKQQFPEVLGVESLNGLYSQTELMQVVLGDVEAGRAFAQQQVADVVVVGRSIAASERERASENALYKTRAVLDLQIYRSLDGKMLETAQTVGVVSGASKTETAEAAMVDAGIKATTQVIVAAALAQLDAPREQGVLITLRGPGDGAVHDAVVNRLRTDPRSVLVEDMFYSDKLGRIRVHYEEHLGTLVDVLEAGTYGGKRIKVIRAMGNRVELTFR